MGQKAVNSKKYTEFINETIITNKIVYHASPYIFQSFKETNTFFSENIKFATEYSESKSIEQGIDYDTNLYICELNGNIFISKYGKYVFFCNIIYIADIAIIK